MKYKQAEKSYRVSEIENKILIIEEIEF